MSRDLTLTVADATDDYNTDEGDGAWIPEYLRWIQNMWFSLTQEEIHWPDYHRFDDDSFRETLRTVYHRNMFVEFTNRFYTEWRDNHIHIPSMYDVDSSVQDRVCSECENDDVWEEEYDMTQAPINPDEWTGWEVSPPRCSAAVLFAVGERNASLRQHMENAWQQWLATRESIGRHNICDERCDLFYDNQADRMRRMIDFNIHWLDAKWQAFIGTTIQIPPIPKPINVLPFPELQIDPAPAVTIRPLSEIAKEARRLRRGW